MGLEPVIYLSKGARVMMTNNLWPEAGLANGSLGTIKKIIYPEGSKPTDLPTAVIIRFDEYYGPSCIEGIDKCVPVPTYTAEWTSHGKNHSRQQIPLKLAWAITIHKSQGQTLNKAVIDIGEKEIASGCTFVALSRMKSIKDCIIKSKEYQRFQRLSKGSRLKERQKEEDRLKQLNDLT